MIIIKLNNKVNNIYMLLVLFFLLLYKQSEKNTQLRQSTITPQSHYNSPANHNKNFVFHIFYIERYSLYDFTPIASDCYSLSPVCKELYNLYQYTAKKASITELIYTDANKSTPAVTSTTSTTAS